ncbi:MAG: hypothetical protein Kow0059_02510 [Candidatus Sumerlaeia bacterium]
MIAPPFGSWRHLLFIVLIGAVHAAYLLSARFGFLDRLANDTWQFSFAHHDPGVDFFVLYEAGWDFLHNRNMYLHHENTAYPPEIPFVERYERSLKEGLTRAPWYATFRYIPFYAATLGVVLNLLPPWGAYWFWVALNEALLWVNCILTLRRCRSPDRRLLAVALWFLPYPLCVEFFLGQFNILMASFIFWTALAWERGSRRGHTWWLLSVLLKNWTYGMGVLLIRRGRWRLPLLAAVIVLITSLPYFLIFPSGWAAFWGAGLSGRVGAGAGAWHWGLWGMQGVQAGVGALLETLGVRSIALPGGWTLGNGATFLVSAAAVGAAVWRSWRDSDWLRPFCLWVLLWFVLYRDCWEHHYILMLPVMAVCLIQNLCTVKTLIIVFLLTQTVTMYALLFPPDSAAALMRQGLYDLLRFAHYTIKPLGVGILFWVLCRPGAGTGATGARG